MKLHESSQIRKKSIYGDLGDSWPVRNRGNSRVLLVMDRFMKCSVWKSHRTAVTLIL